MAAGSTTRSAGKSAKHTALLSCSTTRSKSGSPGLLPTPLSLGVGAVSLLHSWVVITSAIPQCRLSFHSVGYWLAWLLIWDLSRVAALEKRHLLLQVVQHQLSYRGLLLYFPSCSSTSGEDGGVELAPSMSGKRLVPHCPVRREATLPHYTPPPKSTSRELEIAEFPSPSREKKSALLWSLPAR